ncbi:imidazolonepropionase [Halosolutus amylolyticus]|uniref:Imidazolonepropionase n=1 Tax=Halosolutus amylolyticus TaxID=2932267 RepID=A0ABD5PIX2_9EURY|nr:imidazolonepropionase [Halosolutus amylolyticus]
MTDLDAVVYGANELVVGPGDPLETIEDGAIAVIDGNVAAVGPTMDILREYPTENAAESIDATGRAVLPGFVDPHTHAVFAGDRSGEFAAKLRGKTYQEIMAEGGGILSTVHSVREADTEHLVANLLDHLDVMLAHGTTTAEVKSGYGLDTETELRMLEAIDRANEVHPIDVVPTFMGAHAVPDNAESTDEYVNCVVDEQIPAVAEQGIAEFCDVFCEEDVFSVDQSRVVLEAGAAAGLTPKVHAEEFTRLGGAQLAADLGAASADHLLHASGNDAEMLAEAGVTPVCLPGTAFSLGEDYADVDAFRSANAPVALATDFNPNCFSQSMQFAVALGCIGMRMTPAEATVAATVNAASAIDRNDGTGSLEAGAPGDLVIADVPSHVHVPYNFAVNNAETVIKGGRRVYDRDDGIRDDDGHRPQAGSE